ncbi:unnamed protein product, partial [marine sediment metagenome]
VIVMSEGKIVLDNSPNKIFSKLEILRSLALDVPIIPDIVYRLRKRGISIPQQIITTQELINCLTQKLCSYIIPLSILHNLNLFIF